MLEYLASKVSLHPYKTMDTERCVYVVNDEILFSLLTKKSGDLFIYESVSKPLAWLCEP